MPPKNAHLNIRPENAVKHGRILSAPARASQRKAKARAQAGTCFGFCSAEIGAFAKFCGLWAVS